VQETEIYEPIHEAIFEKGFKMHDVLLQELQQVPDVSCHDPQWPRQGNSLAAPY